FYTKISVSKSVRDQDYSAESFASLVSDFRKRSSQIFDINGSTMKRITEHLDKSLSGLRKEETQLDWSQPVNLGEIDARPNVYSLSLLLRFHSGEGTCAR